MLESSGAAELLFQREFKVNDGVIRAWHSSWACLSASASAISVEAVQGGDLYQYQRPPVLLVPDYRPRRKPTLVDAQ